MRLVTRFSCKLNIERNGAKLLGPGLQNVLYTFSVHDSGLLQFSITAKTKGVTIPNSQYIPKRFTNENIQKISTQCIADGRLGITLMNYNASCNGFRGYENPPVLTVVYISNAEPDTLRLLLDTIKAGPSKKSAVEAIEETEAKRKKPNHSVWDNLNLDVMRIIFSYVGGNLAKFRLVSRKWLQALPYLITKVKVLNGREVPGEVVIRIIKKNQYIQDLSLLDCKNLQVTHIKKAMTLPIKRVHTLNLEGCNRLSSQSLFTILISASGLKSLNIKGCDGVDDAIFKDLNPSVHLKHLSEIAFSGNITVFGVRHLVKKFPLISKVEVFGANLTSDFCASILRLQNLVKLIIYYSNSEMLTAGFSCRSKILKKVIIFPVQFSGVCDHPFHLFDAFTKCPLQSLSTNLSPHHLSMYLRHWSELTELTTCELIALPESVEKLCLYTDGHDLLETLKQADRVFLKSLTELRLKVNCEWYIDGIKELMKLHYPLCRVYISKS
ncbi:unnamed protein product [Blepharisma stoltei]|uniref:F-box/LRR-repeat protein n=1 Tax=Blepharisma stoltei TaxID=1481888 RepID=A0AAU9JJC0_9CILI|nr:unnamed protein product [Blepharisma stoltei]